MEWRPIDSAPRDEPIWGWLGWGYPVVAYVQGGEWRTPMRESGYARIPKPSHWLPLPPPPTTGETKP